jgi:hypothetical protein
MLNDMHDIGSIGVVLHHILTSIENLRPNVPANVELSELIAKAVKSNLGVITKMSRVTMFGIQDLAKNVFEHIVVGLQPNYLPISTMTIQIHLLILIHSKSRNLRNSCQAGILVIQTKNASKGRKVNLVVVLFQWSNE